MMPASMSSIFVSSLLTKKVRSRPGTTETSFGSLSSWNIYATFPPGYQIPGVIPVSNFLIRPQIAPNSLYRPVFAPPGDHFRAQNPRSCPTRMQFGPEGTTLAAKAAACPDGNRSGQGGHHSCEKNALRIPAYRQQHSADHGSHNRA